MKYFFTTITIIFFLSNYSWSQTKYPKTSTYSNLEIKNQLNEIKLKLDTTFFQLSNKKDEVNKVFLLQEKGNEFDISSILGILGFLISIYGIWYTKRSFHKEKANKHFEFLSDIDKLLIDNPSLWEIYDKDIGFYNTLGANPQKQGWLDGQLDAFCYLHLNNFEFVFLYPPSKDSLKKTWRDYMIHLIVSSTRFREILIKESVGYIYDIHYRKNMIKYLNLANSILPYYNEYLANTITVEKYYEKANEILNQVSK